MSAFLPITISVVMAIAAGAVVWLVWSVIENVGAARRAKVASDEPAPEDRGENPGA